MAKTVKPEPADQVELIKVQKGDDVMEVHPSCLKAHEELGWVVVQG